LTYRVMGGVIDQFVMVGDTPSEAIGQYMQVIGLPHLPPYWALGWHQCRWGYNTLDEVIDVVNNYTYYGIPLDTMWNDIDYMNEYKDFTTDPVRYPLKRMSDFIKKLHDDGKHYMMIVDPGIFPEKGYAPYDEGLKDDLFIKSSNGSYFLGKVWPGHTYFPDFTHPMAAEYWKNQIVQFHQSGIEFDGLWIDMNEISNFCNGECNPASESRVSATQSRAGRFDPDNPPFKIVNGGDALDRHTISLSARHYSTLEYNAHNLYGHLEGIATKNALESYLQQRSVVIGRSTFAGTGHNSAHWLGDNYSTFQAMYESIAGILTMNLFGIPLVGADICGFNGDTTEEICTRWIELGAFYPFARDHNSVNQRSQEPYAFGPKLAKISRDTLLIRYSILPYLYTQFFTAHVTGQPVARALFFEFPADDNCLELDAQYLLGPSLLITPVLTQGATSVQGYFPPAAQWYDFYTGAPVASGVQTLDAPIDKINLHVRSESVMVMQEPALTTTAARKNPFKLLVALSSTGEANGELYWDDGVSLDVADSGNYGHVIYSVKNDQLKATLEQNGYAPLAALSLTSIRVSGVTSPVTRVLVNGKPVKGVSVSYNSQNQVLAVSGLALSMGSEYLLQWS
jgi:alpha-glucosidase (family GH31 glycosyl hydrolase)